MSTQIIFVTGKSKWARVYQNQMDTAFDKERFHITVYPDEASLIALKASGSKLKIKEDEEGKFVKFHRDNQNSFAGAGGPPKVIDQDGTTFSENIGNGSVVTCKLSVYDTQKFGKGTRLEAVRVDEHVPYEDGSGAGDYPF